MTKLRSLPSRSKRKKKTFDDNTSVTISIVDRQSNPVSGASVEIRQWLNGKWAETEFKGQSNEQGNIDFNGVEFDVYSTILVKHPDYASIMQDFTVTENESRVSRCILAPPVESWIQVLSPDGKPLVGAEITRLEVSTPASESKSFLSGNMFPFLTGKSSSEFKSDPSGRIKLPPLPAGSTATIKVLHPKWASRSTTEVEIVNEKIATVVLTPGTQIKTKLSGVQGTDRRPGGPRKLISIPFRMGQAKQD